MALLVPPPFDVEIDALRRAAGDGALGRIPAHLTLVPPVNVRENELDRACEVLRDAAATTRPITVQLGPPATFLPVNPVLFLAVAKDPGAIRALRDRVFRAPLERSLTHPFVPHVTLADDAPVDRIEAALTAMAAYVRTVTFDAVHLLQEGEGRKWRPIADWRFGAPAVIGRGGLPLELGVSTALEPEAREFAEREWYRYTSSVVADLVPARPLAITARRDGSVVGVATGQIDRERAHLSELLVSAEARGEGIGTHLLRAFESESAAQGVTFVTLSTPVGERAEAFYRARGYVESARLPAERDGRDFVRLMRTL